MAIYNEDIVNIDLNSGTISRGFANKCIGEGDAEANRYGVRVFRGGVPENIGGTCVGFFVRPDGGTVVIDTGVVSGNVAYVTLPSACYAVEGQFSLAIKCQGGDVTGTVRIVDGTVSNTTTQTIVDPGTVLPSIEDLIEAIDDAVASIPADYSALWATIAPNFSAGSSYGAGDYVTYNGGLYRFTTAHSGTWSAGDVVSVNVGGELKAISGELSGVENLEANTVDTTWVLGGISDSGGETISSARARSGYISVKNGEKLFVKHNSYYWCWFRYNESGVFQEKSTFSAGWSQKDGSVEAPEDSLYRVVIRNPNSTSTVVLENIDVVISKQCLIVAAVGSALNNTDALFGFEFVTPPKLNICGGIEFNFYYQNLIRGFNTKKAYVIESSKSAVDYDYFCRLSYAANVSKQNEGFQIRFYPYNENYRQNSDTISFNVVPNTSGSGLSKKILLIGDSLTFNPPMSRHLVDDLLANDVMSVSLIGTLGEAPYLREGRSGWSAYDYTHEASVESVANAFWNPGTSAFDFSYYMTHNGFSGVDYVFINLGTNSGGHTAQEVVDDIGTMVDSIHAYNSNIRIGVWTPPPRGLIGNGNLINNDNTLKRVKAIIDTFSGLESSRIFVVPVTLNVDPYNDFPSQEVSVSARNTAYTMRVATDSTHPSDAGYFKMADVIYCYIKYFGSLDQ